MTDNTNVEGSVDTSTAVDAGEATVEKTYTESEVQAMLQREADRRVTSALNKQKKEFEKQVAESEKLRSMDENQRKEYEYSQKLQELEQRERDFTLAQNKLEATKVMANRKLPIEFVDYIVAEDADTMMNNITVFETAFKAAVADAVAEKMDSRTPRGSNSKQAGLTKEEFKKMSIAQQSEVYRTNPELYKQLTR